MGKDQRERGEMKMIKTYKIHKPKGVDRYVDDATMIVLTPSVPGAVVIMQVRHQ